jgi:hypothetical protein
VQATLQQDLLSPQRQRLLDLLRELRLREEVSLLGGQIAVEGAERALRSAHVRVVDVAVDDLGDDPFRVQPLADGVGQGAQLQRVSVAQQGHAFGGGEPLPRRGRGGQDGDGEEAEVGTARIDAGNWFETSSPPRPSGSAT